MPAIRRRAKSRHDDHEELTNEQRRHLLRGSTFFGGGFKDLESFTDAWKFHRAELLPEFIQKHPGERPFAWWICTHKKERPIVGTWMTPEELTRFRDQQAAFYSSKFGFLHSSVWAGGYLQQPEEDYLREHGLLTAEELAVNKT